METETSLSSAGEYITIYQYQRQQIRKRMEEKESQLTAVSLEREELKLKLAQLQSLVTTYMRRAASSAPDPGDAQGTLLLLSVPLLLPLTSLYPHSPSFLSRGFGLLNGISKLSNAASPVTKRRERSLRDKFLPTNLFVL